MRHIMKTAASLGILFTLATAGQAAAQTDRGWQIALSAASMQSTSGDDLASALGVALDLGYRISPRFGVGLEIATGELESELEIDFFDAGLFAIESKMRATPVLARLDWHLTPGRRADLYLGPVIGQVRYGDVETEIRGDVLGGETVPVERLETKDSFAWGAHIGVDLPIGNRGAFFTAGATWLQAEVETEGFDDPEDFEDGGDFDFDLNPLIARVGFGYRF